MEKSNYFKEDKNGLTQFHKNIISALGLNIKNMRLIDIGWIDIKLRKKLSKDYQELSDNLNEKNAEEFIEKVRKNKNFILSDIDKRIISEWKAKKYYEIGGFVKCEHCGSSEK
ncbi:MAG: hypothetical protein AABY22_25330 [Nanoarchaeota archaeon]